MPFEAIFDGGESTQFPAADDDIVPENLSAAEFGAELAGFSGISVAQGPSRSRAKRVPDTAKHFEVFQTEHAATNDSRTKRT